MIDLHNFVLSYRSHMPFLDLDSSGADPGGSRGGGSEDIPKPLGGGGG